MADFGRIFVKAKIVRFLLVTARRRALSKEEVSWAAIVPLKAKKLRRLMIMKRMILMMKLTMLRARRRKLKMKVLTEKLKKMLKIMRRRRMPMMMMKTTFQNR